MGKVTSGELQKCRLEVLYSFQRGCDIDEIPRKVPNPKAWLKSHCDINRIVKDAIKRIKAMGIRRKKAKKKGPHYDERWAIDILTHVVRDNMISGMSDSKVSSAIRLIKADLENRGIPNDSTTEVGKVVKHTPPLVYSTLSSEPELPVEIVLKDSDAACEFKTIVGIAERVASLDSDSSIMKLSKLFTSNKRSDLKGIIIKCAEAADYDVDMTIDMVNLRLKREVVEEAPYQPKPTTTLICDYSVDSFLAYFLELHTLSRDRLGNKPHFHIGNIIRKAYVDGRGESPAKGIDPERDGKKEVTLYNKTRDFNLMYKVTRKHLESSGVILGDPPAKQLSIDAGRLDPNIVGSPGEVGYVF